MALGSVLGTGAGVLFSGGVSFANEKNRQEKETANNVEAHAAFRRDIDKNAGSIGSIVMKLDSVSHRQQSDTIRWKIVMGILCDGDIPPDIVRMCRLVR